MAWLDTGSIGDYYKTSAFVQAIENRQGLKIACLEEIALLNKWITKSQVIKQIKFYGNCEYSNYLKKIIKRLLIYSSRSLTPIRVFPYLKCIGAFRNVTS